MTHDKWMNQKLFFKKRSDFLSESITIDILSRGGEGDIAEYSWMGLTRELLNLK